ncbi:MAG TPA: hypothetical protein DD672_05925 [Gammaproteobacteria bacterium]|nr:hypothetical protein [Gammaproteobacteria bacterium]
MDIDIHAAAPEFKGANNDTAYFKVRLFCSIRLISSQKYLSIGLELLKRQCRRSVLELPSEEYGQTLVKFTAVPDHYHYHQSVVASITSQ